MTQALLSGSLIIFVGLGGCDVQKQEPSDPTVGYCFEYHPGRARGIQITLRVPGESGDSSRFAVAPSWGGVQNCERFIHDVRARDDQGNPCHISRNGPHGWKVAHRPGAILEFAYKLRPAEIDPLADRKTIYEPVVRDDLLHLIGETGMVYPEWLEDRGPVNIELQWVGFKEHGWNTASSFDAGNGRLHCPLKKFRRALFLAGKIRVHDRKIRGGLLRVAIQGDDWRFEDREMVDVIERIITTEREFMQDFSDPYYLVTIVASGPRASPSSYSMSGTCLTNCFAMFLSPGIAVDPPSPHRQEFLRLLAHEYFHNWNGGKIGTDEAEELVYWFTEGFTDFYASRVLRRAGLIDDAQFIERLNETLRSLWLSPVATAPGQTIRGEFWSREEVQKLPYQRGEIVAVLLDEEIRRASGNRRTLDDFMRELFSPSTRAEPMQTDRLISRMAEWTSPQFAQSLRQTVVDGALPDPPRQLSEPTADKSEVEHYPYEPGFDIDASIDSKVVTGVQPGTAAHSAGLRDGQPILAWSIYQGDPDRQFEMTVHEQRQPRPIRFYPRGKAIKVPRYTQRMKSRIVENPYFKGG